MISLRRPISPQRQISSNNLIQPDDQFYPDIQFHPDDRLHSDNRFHPVNLTQMEYFDRESFKRPQIYNGIQLIIPSDLYKACNWQKHLDRKTLRQRKDLNNHKRATHHQELLVL